MNNKGFTLSELLAVIALIAIVTMIAGVSYTKITKDNKIKQCEQKIALIEKQAVKYASDTYMREGTEEKFISDLVCEGYLEVSSYSCPDDAKVLLVDDEKSDDIINPITNEQFEGKIIITKSNGLITAKYRFETGEKCE